MTGSLEFAKLVVATWLFDNWKNVPFLLKTYMTIAVIVLMLITDLGVFGFLSKAHIDQTLGSQDNGLIINQLNQEIQDQQNQVTDAQSQITQMDQSVNSILQQSTSATAMKRQNSSYYAMTASKLREKQQSDRAALEKQILDANTQISDLNNQKIKLEQADNKSQADIGPLLYIAQMLYGDNVTPTMQEHAVRAVIMMIIFVFDPLAVLSVIAANMGFALHRKKKDEAEALKIIPAPNPALTSIEIAKPVNITEPSDIKEMIEDAKDKVSEWQKKSRKKRKSWANRTKLYQDRNHNGNIDVETEVIYPNLKPLVRESISFETIPPEPTAMVIGDDKPNTRLIHIESEDDSRDELILRPSNTSTTSSIFETVDGLHEAGVMDDLTRDKIINQSNTNVLDSIVNTMVNDVVDRVVTEPEPKPDIMKDIRQFARSIPSSKRFGG